MKFDPVPRYSFPCAGFAMSVSDSGIVNIMSRKLGYLAQKQAVQAENVANANTPGYKAKTLVPFTFDDAMKGVSAGMATTDARHIVPASMAGANAGTKTEKAYETVPSGNSVDLEQQMMDVSKTTMDYQASVTILQKFMTLLRSAIGARG